jgi:hypothetical protein
MKFTSTATIELDDIMLTNMRGRERRCAECNIGLENGDMVMVFAPTTFNEDEGVPLDDIYLVHVKRKDGGTCLDDFVARYINGISGVLETEKPPKDPVKAGPSPVTEQQPSTSSAAPPGPAKPNNQTAPGPDWKPETPIVPST